MPFAGTSVAFSGSMPARSMPAAFSASTMVAAAWFSVSVLTWLRSKLSKLAEGNALVSCATIISVIGVTLATATPPEAASVTECRTMSTPLLLPLTFTKQGSLPPSTVMV